MFLEIGGKYVERETRDYHPLAEDRDRIIVLYNPACEWGPYLAFKVEQLGHEIDPDLPVETFNIWESPEAFTMRPLKKVISGHVIANTIIIDGSVFWADQNAFRQELEKALRYT
jgi:hypothetical protein